MTEELIEEFDNVETTLDQDEESIDEEFEREEPKKELHELIEERNRLITEIEMFGVDDIESLTNANIELEKLNEVIENDYTEDEIEEAKQKLNGGN